MINQRAATSLLKKHYLFFDMKFWRPHKANVDMAGKILTWRENSAASQSKRAWNAPWNAPSPPRIFSCRDDNVMTTRDKNGSVLTFYLFFQRVNARPLFGTVPLQFSCPSACGLVSAVFASLALSVPVSKKRVNALYPFLDSLRTVPLFIRFTTSVNGQCLSERFQFLSEPFQLFCLCKWPLSLNKF